MPVDLIPIPERGEIVPPASEDPLELRRALADLIQDWNRLRPILRQNVNRLDLRQPDPLAPLRAEVLEIGRLLAAVVHGARGETLDGLQDPVQQMTTGDVRRIVSKYRHTKYGGPTDG